MKEYGFISKKDYKGSWDRLLGIKRYEPFLRNANMVIVFYTGNNMHIMLGGKMIKLPINQWPDNYYPLGSTIKEILSSIFDHNITIVGPIA